MNNEFFEMVRKWTVRDYRTPGIKAEVILDMLISEFVEDLIKYHFSEQNKTVDVNMLVKEFPIRTLDKDGNKKQNDKNKRNAKVDYLVCINKKELLLVELKTSKKSFDKKQKNRMEQVIADGINELFDFYEEICKAKSGSKKYKFSELTLNDNLTEAEFSREDIRKKCKPDYMYIFLDDYSGNTKIPKEKKLILTDYCKNEKFMNTLSEDKKEKWNYVSMILLECAGKA